MERIIDNPDERTWGMLCHLSALAGYIYSNSFHEYYRASDCV